MRTHAIVTLLVTTCALLPAPVVAQTSGTEVNTPVRISTTLPARIHVPTALTTSTGAWALATARASVEAAVTLPVGPQRMALLEQALSAARRVVATDPADAEAHYWVAAAVGLQADMEGGRTKIRLAEEAWAAASRALEIDPDHAGAHHIHGRLHASVMRLSWVARTLARHLLGADVLGEASWERAEYHLARAAALAPDDAVNHLELGLTLRDRGRVEEARAAFQRALEVPGDRPVDRAPRARAQALLDEG